MDMDITMERLIDDLEGVISQINDIVARKDIQAARRAMEQIAEIVRADNPDVELDTRTDPNMDHVLHELLSRINGVIELKAKRTYVLEETEEARKTEEELHIIDTEIDQIDIEINNIRRSRKSNSTDRGEEESETSEDKTLVEVNARIDELTARRIQLSRELRKLRDSMDVGTPGNDSAYATIFAQIHEINAEISELEAQREKLQAQPNVDQAEIDRQNTHDRIIQLEQEIANLEQQRYREVERIPGDSFAILNRNLNPENFQEGEILRIGDREITLNPAVHRIISLHAEDVYGGEEADLGPTGEFVLQEVDPEIQSQIDSRRQELENLLRTLTPDKNAAIAEIDAKIKTLQEKAKTLGEDLRKAKGEDELYAQIYSQLASTNEEIRRLQEERQNLLQVSTTRTKRGPQRIIKSDEKLTEEQRARIKILLYRKQELLLRRKEVVKEVRKHQRVIVTGENDRYDLTAVAKELGDPFFKTHEIREELASRGLKDEDYLRFYRDGLVKFGERKEQLDAQISATMTEIAEIGTAENGLNLVDIIRRNDITPEQRLKALELVRRNFLKNDKFKAQMEEAGFDKQLTAENVEEFAKFFETYQNNQVLLLNGMRKERQDIDFSMRVLNFEIDSIERGRQSEEIARDGGESLRVKAEDDKKLRDEQIATTMYGNPEMEEKWDETVKRFYSHRKVAENPIEFRAKDGTVKRINYDTIEDYDGLEADAHFLNLDDYKKYLELVSIYDNIEKEEPGGGLAYLKEHFDFFSDNPAFAEAYNKLLEEHGQEAADKLLQEYINEKKEYVKTFHGMTNREAVKHATLKTAGSTLTAMRPVRGNLPTPVKMGNAVSNVFRFIGLRAPHFSKVDANGNKVPTIKSGIGTILTDALVIGAGALAVASGPVGIATWAAAYGVRGAVTAGNVVAANRYYKKHKDVIDAGLPTLAEPPEYTKEVARRDYYRNQIMKETGKAEVGLIRQFTTWMHAKTDRLPFRKASREAANEAIVAAQQGRMHTEIDENIDQRVEVAERNAEQHRKNQEIRDANQRVEAKGQVTYNSVVRDPNHDNIDEMEGNVAVNAALRSRGSELRVDVAKGNVGTAEQVGAGRFKKPDEDLQQTEGMEVIPEQDTTKTASTAITEEQHYQGEKEHRDFWNRVITAAGTVAAGMAIRFAHTKFIEHKLVQEGTEPSQRTVHHDEETRQEWVDGHKEVKEVGTEVDDYATQYDTSGHTLQDVTAANRGRTVTGYETVSGGNRGAAQYTLRGDEQITAMWQDDGTHWGTGVGDTAGLNQHTGFIDRTVDPSMLSSNGVMNQQLTVEELIRAVGSGKVDPSTLQGTYVSLGDNYWVSLKELMEGMTKQVKIGSHTITAPQEVFVPGHYENVTIPAWDEVVNVPGTAPVYEDVFSWKLLNDAFTQSALAGAGVGAIDALHEASRATYRTSVDSLGRNGGEFTDRNGILAKNQDLISRIVEQQKAAIMKKRQQEQEQEEVQDAEYEEVEEDQEH